MAKLEHIFQGDFDETLYRLHSGILNGSMSASYEDKRSGRAGACAARYAFTSDTATWAATASA